LERVLTIEVQVRFDALPAVLRGEYTAIGRAVRDVV